jgi:hypothetical protein
MKDNYLTSTAFPSELEIKDTTESSTSASYLDVLLNIDADGKLTTQLYDKQDNFSFTIVNFPYICSNIPLSRAYERKMCSPFKIYKGTRENIKNPVSLVK